ncbi:MAG: hypothetical protein N2050_06860 [Flavobacteriales bacterium]|nr:hypothetical protein [Flavobacteriales bacterium]
MGPLNSLSGERDLDMHGHAFPPPPKHPRPTLRPFINSGTDLLIIFLIFNKAALSVSACKSAVRAGGGVGRPGASGRSLRPASAAHARPPLAGFPAPPGRFSLLF